MLAEGREAKFDIPRRRRRRPDKRRRHVRHGEVSKVNFSLRAGKADRISSSHAAEPAEAAELRNILVPAVQVYEFRVHATEQ